MSEADILPTLAVLVVGTAALLAAQTWFTLLEARWLALSFVAHVLSSFAQIWIVLSVYGIGDMLMYHSVGIDLANAMRSDFLGVGPQVALAALQQPYNLSIFIPASGSATGSMCALMGFANVLLDDSLVAANLLFAIFAYFGKLLVYVAFRRWVGPELHRWLIIAILLVPSSVFWSAGILKEAVAMPGIGLFVLGMDRIIARSGARWAWPSVFLGVLVIAMLKPYILVALVPATGVYLYWRRSVDRGQVVFRPLLLVLGAAVVVMGILAVGELSPRFSIDRIGDETARMQEAGLTPRGGSTYVIGDPSQRTFLGQLAYAPLALLTALYRPLVLEISNPQMALSSIENAALAGVSIWLLLTKSPLRLWRVMATYPFLVLCGLFVLVFGVGVGLTSANLGTLSRYRVPLMPFFCVLLAVLGVSTDGASRVRR